MKPTYCGLSLILLLLLGCSQAPQNQDVENGNADRLKESIEIADQKALKDSLDVSNYQLIGLPCPNS